MSIRDTAPTDTGVAVAGSPSRKARELWISAFILPFVPLLASVMYMDGFAPAEDVREAIQGDACRLATIQRSLDAGQPLTRYEVFLTWNGCRAPTDGLAGWHRWRERRGAESDQALSEQRRAMLADALAPQSMR